MKHLWIMGIILGVLFIGILSTLEVIKHYKYEKEINSYWSLAIKTSELSAKSSYIDQYVDILSKSGLQGRNNAIILKTPNNSFDKNLGALQTLQQRLHNIQTIDQNSFSYQIAIQQITGQEQGEAREMLKVFYGTWVLAHYPFLWGWIEFLLWLFTIMIPSTMIIWSIYKNDLI